MSSKRFMIGALVGLGIPEEDANFYAEGVKRGGVLVTVRADDSRSVEALQVLRQTNAFDVDTRRSEWAKSGWKSFDEQSVPDDSYPVLSNRQ